MDSNLDSNLQEYFDCQGKINYFSILSEAMSLKYFSNCILFSYLLLYIYTRSGLHIQISINYIQDTLYVLLITNAIIASYLFTCHWKKVASKFIKLHCFPEKKQKLDETIFTKLHDKYRNEMVYIRLAVILIHWLPILLVSPMITSSEPLILGSLFIVSMYMSVIQNPYGNLPALQYIIMYLLTLFIIGYVVGKK